LALAAVAAACVGLARVDATYSLTDFHCFWNSGRFVIDGADPYDTTRWTAATAGLFPDGNGGFRTATCPSRFAYPLWTAMAFAPLGLLPEGVAAALWAALLLVGAIGGLVLVWRAAGGPPGSLPTYVLVVASSQPFWFTIITLQLGGVLLGLLGVLTAASRLGRPVPAGLALAALAVKPHVTWAVLPAVAVRAVRRREWRLLTGATGLAAFGTALSLAIAPSWPASWLGDVLTTRAATGPVQATPLAVAAVAPRRLCRGHGAGEGPLVAGGPGADGRAADRVPVQVSRSRGGASHLSGRTVTSPASRRPARTPTGSG